MTDGVVNLLKPTGMTSHEAVAAVRRLFKQRQAGHAGTLDPGACGVLPIFLGKATRLIPYMPGEKAYRAEMTLGIATATQDASGETTDVADLAVTPNQLGEAFAAFLGAVWQTPPMYSAVKVGGKRLYELARAGVDVKRKPRLTHIFELHIRRIWPEDATVLGLGSRVLFDVRCSAGTYIRTLCVDIAARLGCLAHMSFLVRTQAGPFALADAATLAELEAAAAAGRLSEYTLPPVAAVPHLPSLRASAEAVRLISHGAVFAAAQPAGALGGETVCVQDEAGRLIALAEPAPGQPGRWQPKRVFI